MKAKQFSIDFLLGTCCTACSILIMVMIAVIFSASWAESPLTLFGGTAAILYLNILLLRTPDKSARISRTVTAFLMYFPMLGVCYLISRNQSSLMLGNMSFDGLCFLLIVGLPVAFLLMGIAAVYAAKQKTHPFIPLVLMYVLYAVCQGDAFRLATLKSLSSDSLSLIYYTQQARISFFELCAVAVINFTAVLLLNRSVRNGTASRPKRLKGLAAALCLYTVFIAATVLAEMTVYIRVHGLSERRLYASWFTVTIGTAFLLLFIRQFIRKLPAAAVPAVSFAVLAGLMIHVHPEQRIAEYNIGRYESGTLEELDVEMLCGMSDEAYTVMAQHEDTLRRAGQWETYQYHADARRMNGTV